MYDKWWSGQEVVKAKTRGACELSFNLFSLDVIHFPTSAEALSPAANALKRRSDGCYRHR